MCKRFAAFAAFLLFIAFASHAQNRKVTGKVFSDENGPLSGTTIQIKGSKLNIATDNDGSFSINIPDKGNVTLKVSHIGYESKEFVIKNQFDFPNIVLAKKQSEIDAVVVVGYGTSRRKDLTGSVEKLDLKDLSKAPVRSFEEALGGRAAGVQVVSSDGQPGSPVSIVIRGNNSITQDNSPLYVVDGFPVEGYNNNAINVSDIESIEVLKDASAAAIYGARAANGVIIITTKKGKSGKTEISYNAYVGVNQIIKKIDVLSPYEFVKYQYDYDSINCKNYYLSNGRTIDYYKNVNGVNWQDLIFRNSMMMNHELAIRGGNEFTSFSLSGSALNQDGIVKYSGYNRYQGRIRLDHKINKKVKVGMNLNYSSLKSYGTIPSSLSNSSSSTSNLMYSVWGYRPVTGDSLTDLLSGTDPAFDLNLNDSRFNPQETVQFEQRNRYSNVMNSNFNFDYQIRKDLLFKSTFGVINDVGRNEEFNGKNTYSGSPNTAAGRVNGVNGSIVNNTKNTYVNENTLSYNHKINNKNSFDALLGATVQSVKQNIFGAAATQLPNEQLGLSGLDEGRPSTITSYQSKNNLVSFLSRINYNYNSKYLMTVSMRADGSSKFAPKNKWSYFPSGSVAWRFSKESFMKSFKFLKDGKLRFSYGVLGNNRVSDFAYLSTLSTQAVLAYPFNGVITNTIVPNALGNPNLKWETTSQANLGLDLNLFSEKITITTDVYNKVTSNLLLNAQLPPSSGFTQAYKNVGKVQNKGLEFSISTKNFDHDDFKWTTSFNISFNRNKVLALNDGQESLLSNINWDNQWRGLPAYMAKVGQPLGLIYGVIWDGNYQYSDFIRSGAGTYTLNPTVTSNTSVYDPAIQPGYIKYRDLNGDRIINDNDKTIIGNTNPDFIGGFTNNVKYKNFDLNIFFQFSYGNDILNANRLVFEGNSGRILQNQFTTVLNRWSPENQNNVMFIARGDGDRVYSSRVVEDGSYLRLKTLQLGYQMPEKLMKKSGIKNLRFYLSAQNLITWTKYTGVDPEVSVYNSALTPGFDYSVYPRAKTLTFGLNLNL